MLIFALFAMSLDLLLGYAGLASLGHAAYFGVAAYTVALLVLRARRQRAGSPFRRRSRPPPSPARCSRRWRCARAAAIS